MNVQIAQDETAIADCFDAFHVLRPHLTAETFTTRAMRQMQQHGYIIAYIKEQDTVVTAAGYRITEFLAWGKTLYLDDLVTLPEHRNKGYAGIMLDWLMEEAKRHECDEFHLDSGPQRHDAHRLYLSKKMNISAYHFSLSL